MALFSGAVLVGIAPLMADTANVTNSVTINANSGGNSGATVTNGSVSRTVDVVTIVNGEVVTDIHKSEEGSGVTTVNVTYGNGQSANGSNGADGEDGSSGANGRDGADGQAGAVIEALTTIESTATPEPSTPPVPTTPAPPLAEKELEPIPVSFTASASDADALAREESFIPKTLHRFTSFFSFMKAYVISMFTFTN